MGTGVYFNYGHDEAYSTNVPSSQGGTGYGVSSVTIDINDSTMSAGWSMVMVTCSTNPNGDGSSSIEPSTYFQIWPKNSSNSYINADYCLSANSTHSILTSGSSSDQNARISYWTSIGHAAAAIAAGGERHQMLLSCSHLSDGTHISCHVMTCQNNGSRNYHTTEIITASPARYLNFRGTSNWFYQWRSKTYFLGASP